MLAAFLKDLLGKPKSRRPQPRPRFRPAVEVLEDLILPSGTPYQLAFLQQPTQAVAQQVITPPIEVEVLDSSGNLVTTANDIIELAWADGDGTSLGGTFELAAVGGIATFNDTYFLGADPSATLEAADPFSPNNIAPIFSNPFPVVPVATSTAVTSTPNPSTVGQPVTFTATVTPMVPPGGAFYGVISTGVEFTEGGIYLGFAPVYSDSGSYQGTWSTSDLSVGSNTINAILQLGFNNSFTSSSATITQVVNPVANTPPTLANPGNETNQEGDTVSLQLQGSDTDGGTLSYSEVGLPAGLGVGFSTGLISGIVSATPGQYPVTATVTDGATGLTASQSFTWTVTSAAPDYLAFIQQPTDAVVGQIISPPVSVGVYDMYGNLATGPGGLAGVTLTLVGNGILGGNTSVFASDGVATFPDLSVDQPGIGDRLAASSGGLPTVLSSLFSITSAAATQLVVSAPSSVMAGSPFDVTVTAEDAYGNVATAYTGTVHFTSTDTLAILPADYTFQSSDQGVHVFTGVVLQTLGLQTITATDTVTSSITGSANVTVTNCQTPNLSPLTDEQQVAAALAQVQGLVSSGVIPAGQGLSLLTDLTGAQQALAVDDAPTAAQQLSAFQSGLWSLVNQGVLSSSVASNIFTPTVVYWTGAGDGSSWNDPANWNDNAVPDDCDDVYIQTTPGLVIEHPSGDVTIHSLHSYNPINFTGSLTLATDSEVHETFNFNGTLEQMFGTLELDGGGNLAGTLDGGDRTLLLLATGNFTVADGTLFSGDGTLSLGTGTGVLALAADTEIDAGKTVDDKKLTTLGPGDTLGGAGTFSVKKEFTWTGGTMKGSGDTVIEATGTMTVSGKKDETQETRTINNKGTINWNSGNGSEWTLRDARLENEGFFNINGDASLVGSANVATPTFINGGIITKTLPTTTAIQNLSFQNNLQVVVNAGTLNLQGTEGTSIGWFFAASGATVHRSGGSTSAPRLEPTVSILPGFFTLGGPGQYIVDGRAELAIGKAVLAQNFELGPLGTLSGAASFEARNFLWTGGTMQTTGMAGGAIGTTFVGTGDVMTISGKLLGLRDRKILDEGIIQSVTEGDNVSFLDPRGAITVDGGQFNVAFNLQMTAAVPPVPGTFQLILRNNGTFFKALSEFAAPAVIQVSLLNAGGTLDDQGNLTVGAVARALFRQTSGQTVVGGFGTLTAGTGFTQDGGTTTVDGTFTATTRFVQNGGTTTVNVNGTLTAGTGYTQEAGTTTVTGSLDAIKEGVRIKRGSFLLNGGVIEGGMTLGVQIPSPAVALLRGFGTILGGLDVLTADVDPRGLLNIGGDLLLNANAVLEVRIGGNGLQGIVDVTGALKLNGKPDLNITLLGGFVPAANTQYTFLTFGKKEGSTFNQFRGGKTHTVGGVTFGLLINKNSMALVVK